MKFKWDTPGRRFIAALVIATLISEGFFVYDAARTKSLQFDYLSWNLVLAWLPLVFAARLDTVLKRKLWSSWEALALSVLWLIFLPNTFYMVSDFIHLQDTSASNAVYAAVLLTSFIYTGVTLGFSSLYLVHLQLKKRFSSRESAGWVAFVLFVCSVGVYFGRNLRWNSWDIFTNPGGLLVDIYDHLAHIATYPEMTETTLAFFLLLCTMYNLLWRAVHMLQVDAHESGE